MINYLIFDGNFIFHKCVQSLKNTTNFYGGLYRLLEMTIEKYVKLNRWDKIIIVSDSQKKSWRTKLQNDYKGKRVKDETIDWKFAYETYKTFKEDLKEKYYVIEEDHIEGDDWIFFLTKYANKNKMGVCVISSDRDLYQLIKYNLNDEYMNIQIADKSHNEKVMIPQGWELLYNKILNNDGVNNLFNMSNTSFNIDFFNYCKDNFTVKEINNIEYLFNKILIGDVGDNIQSVHKVLTTTGSLRGIGEKTAQKIWEHYSFSHDEFDTKNVDHLYEMINSYENIKKTEFSTTIKNSIYNNICNNIKMMELKIASYPVEIKDIIIEKILDTFDIND